MSRPEPAFGIGGSIVAALAAGALFLASCGNGPEGGGAPDPAGGTAGGGGVVAPGTAAAKGPEEPIGAPPPPGVVVGRVVGPDGKPVADAVVWLRFARAPEKAPPRASAVLNQKGKAFQPRVLPVQVGSTVEIRNSDPVLHNVYSRSPAKTFDLGMCCSTDVRSVVFDRPGRVDLFCAVHTNMHAIVMVLETPCFATTDADGRFRVEGVPPGPADVVVWHEIFREGLAAIEMNGDRGCALALRVGE